MEPEKSSQQVRLETIDDCNEYRKTLIDARMIFMELSSKEVSFMTYILRTIAMVIIASLF
jgi:hypothetical protein